METLRYFIGTVLPYVAVAVFAGGMAYRIRAWLKRPSPAITLFPAPPSEAANLANTVREAFLFRSLFRGDRLLWAMAWSFHAVLLLIFIGHGRVFANVDSALASLGMDERDIQAMSSGVGGAAGVAVLAATLLLLGRRMTLRRVREITGWGDVVILLLIAAVITTGNLMRFGAEHFDLAAARSYFASLATFSGVAGAAMLNHNVFLLHMCLALVLIMCMPFSKLLHFGGIFFTHQLIRRQ